MAMVRITNAIFGDENCVLTVSAMLQGEYGLEGTYLGLPCILSREGIREILSLPLTQTEQEQLTASFHSLKELFSNLRLS